MSVQLTERRDGEASVIAEQLRELAERFGLNSVEIAEFLQNPGDDYPSSGLIRTMLRGMQAPSERFCNLLNVRLGELHEQIEAGLVVLQLDGRIRRVYRVTRQHHVMTILKADEIDLNDRTITDAKDAFQASEAAPNRKLRRCRICDRLFVPSSTRQYVCRREDEQGRCPCVLEADRRYQTKRRKLSRKQA